MLLLYVRLLVLLNTLELKVLQLLSFFKMSFYLFSVCSLFAMMILMPLNWKVREGILDF